MEEIFFQLSASPVSTSVDPHKGLLAMRFLPKNTSSNWFPFELLINLLEGPSEAHGKSAILGDDSPMHSIPKPSEQPKLHFGDAIPSFQ